MEKAGKGFMSIKLKATAVFVLSHLILGWSFPKGYNHYDSFLKSNDKLEYVTIIVNGLKQKVRSGEELHFLKGDVIEVRSAELNSGSNNVGEINVVGFSSRNAKKPGDDRGIEIDTKGELRNNHWTVRGKNTFVAMVTTKRYIHGSIFLKRVVPQLSYIDVLINDKVRVLRDGEKLKVRLKDKFEVKRVVSNLKNSKDISFKIVPVKPGENLGETPRVKKYRIEVRHRDYIFAQIPLHVDAT